MKLFEVVVIMLVGVIIGTSITKYWANQDMHDMKADAVMYECGFWDVNGDFDWKSPELMMVND